MRISIRCLTVAATGLLGIALTSCDRNSDRNTNPLSPPTAPSSPAPSSPTLTRVELIAPDSIAPGESVQLTANAIKSDGSVENVAERAQWSSSDPRVLEVSATGMAKGIANGEPFISVRYQTRGATGRILVLPPGTYRLVGRVTENGFGLSGVTLAVDERTTVTVADGGYAFYGLSGRVRIHAKREGYLNRIEEIDVSSHRSFDFEMTADRARPDLRGPYTLTVGGGTCSLPVQSAATRTYIANATQDGARMTVTLSGADFIVTRGRGNHFDGYFDANGTLTFAIGDVGYYYYYGQYDIVERFSDTVALIVDGTVTAKSSPTGISGTLAGSIRLAQGTTAPFTRLQGTCYASNHRFEMVRR